MILNFFKIAANLKKISRQGWVDKLSLKNPESVADHSYLMAVIGMVISDLGNYNSEKIIKMILLHDLAESKISSILVANFPSQANKLYLFLSSFASPTTIAASIIPFSIVVFKICVAIPPEAAFKCICLFKEYPI